jgi:hypothetical protein
MLKSYPIACRVGDLVKDDMGIYTGSLGTSEAAGMAVEAELAVTAETEAAREAAREVMTTRAPKVVKIK